MTHCRQLIPHFLRHAFLDISNHIKHPALSRHPTIDVDRFKAYLEQLRRHLESKHVKKHLYVALRQHKPSNDAVNAVSAAMVDVGDHCQDDGVVGPLVGGVHVGVVRVEVKVRAAVLQRQITTFRGDGRAEACIVTVDKGVASAAESVTAKQTVSEEFFAGEP